MCLPGDFQSLFSFIFSLSQRRHGVKQVLRGFHSVLAAKGHPHAGGHGGTQLGGLRLQQFSVHSAQGLAVGRHHLVGDAAEEPAVCLPGFGAGLAVFMFAGFLKGIPLEIEEAAAIDGCGPIRTFFLIVFPMLKPVLISVGVLEIMWIWNDYLLPYLVLDRTKYKTIPIHIQYLQGSYGHVDLGAVMALIVISIVPIVVFYLTAQKYIIKGMTAGAVKG